MHNPHDVNIHNRRAFLKTIAGASVLTQRLLNATPAHARMLSRDLTFPGQTWSIMDPQQAGWKPKSLAAAIDYGMKQQSSGIVVVHRGHIIAERHTPDVRITGAGRLRYRTLRHGTNQAGHAIEDVASVQKSVVSILFGIAQHRQLIRLQDTVTKHLGAGWSKADATAESRITLRHLLTMSSGLNDKLEYRVPPGTKWQYNTGAYSQSLTAICRAANMEPNPLTRKWLTSPLGMSDSKWVKRQTVSSAANRLGFATTTRDLARIGVLMLARGEWNGVPIVHDKAYLRESISPSQTMNPAYGYLWWLNGARSAIRSGRRVRGPLVPGAPDDLFAALGALGRKLYVVPSRQLVVARLGGDPGRGFGGTFWSRLMQAAPVQDNPSA